MPFSSEAQQRWAFGTGQPFAKRWADETDFSRLPKKAARKWGKRKKAAGTDAGASLHGPGGLLAGPGLGKRLKVMSRSEAARHAALVRWGKEQPKPEAASGAVLSKPTKVTAPKPPSTPKRGGGKGGRKAGGRGAAKPPKQTEEEKRQDQEAKKLQRQAEREQLQKQNTAETLQKLNIAPDGQEALEALRRGEQPDPEALARGGFEQAGLVERAQDGTYRMTASGRALLNAAAAGDLGRAGDIISGARDRTTARTGRQAAAAERKKKAEERRAEVAARRAERQKKGGGGKGKQPKERARRQPAEPLSPEDAASQTGLSPGNLRALRQAAQGAQGLTMDVLRPLETAGLTSDGEITAEGRRALAALERGDVGAFSVAAQEGRKKISTKAADPGDYLVVEDRAKPSTYHLQVKQNGKPDHRLMGAAQAALHGGYRGNTYEGPQKGEALAKLKRLYAAEKMTLPTEKSFVVFKDHTGHHRWVARTTTAYRDRDDEIISTDALDQDSQRMMATRQLGPLRWWHIGQPDPLDVAAPWGPGLDIGDCDYSTVIGRTRVESGTFRDPVIAEKMARVADGLEMSPGFFYPANQPGPDGVFTHIRTFERSPVPVRYGRASNLFTGFTVKEHRMDPTEMERRFKALITSLQLAPEQAQALAAGLVQTEKAAAQQGIAFKSDDAPAAPPEEITIGGVVYAVKAFPPNAEEPMVEEKQPDAMMAEEVPMEADPAGDFIGDMTPEEFWSGMTQALSAALAPLAGLLDIEKKMAAHVDSVMGGYKTKDDSHAQEIASLKSRLAALEGDQPAAPLPTDVAQAMKSDGPQPPPDPSKPDVPNDPARPFAGLAAQLWPQLYVPGQQ